MTDTITTACQARPASLLASGGQPFRAALPRSCISGVCPWTPEPVGPRGRRACRREPRHHRVAVQAARDFIFLIRDLRRHQRRVGLRALGVELKNKSSAPGGGLMVQDRNDIVGLDAGILMHPQVWVTSGHVGSFSDPLVESQHCRRRYRLDELPGAEDLSANEHAGRDDRGAAWPGVPTTAGPLSAPRRFNLMFTSHMGPVEDDASIVYFPPETAQGSLRSTSERAQQLAQKLPFGIAQIGKSFRNEISPGNFVFGCASSSRWRCSTSSAPARRRPPSRNGCPSAGPGTRPMA